MFAAIEKSKSEKRSSERYDYPSTIEYMLDAPAQAEVHRAVTINISTSGIGAYVFAPHREGQKIIIKTPLPVKCTTATVCWVKKEDDSFYLIGLKCLLDA